MKLWPIPPYFATDDEILARSVYGITRNNRQVGGDHYQSKAVQPWDAMEAWMTQEQFSGYLRGNAIKYLARCDDKGGIEDLEKAKHYLEKLIEFKTKEGK